MLRRAIVICGKPLAGLTFKLISYYPESPTEGKYRPLLSLEPF
jgi:hypothetical protein